jgi:hypothetical protein
LAADGGLLALLLAGAVQVASTTPCPSAADVEARLPALTSPATGPPDRALIRGAEGILTLTLVRADGSAVIERQIAAQGSCADLAGAVALIVAVWQAQEHPDIPLAPTLREPPAPPPPALTLEARTDFFASLAGAEVSPGATLSAILWRRRWGLALSASGTTLREQALGRGRAAWTRGSVGLGLARRLLAGWARVDLDVHGLLGLTVARGSGYLTDAVPVGSTFGGGAGLTVSHAWRRLVVSAGASATRWMAQDMAVDATATRQPLPRTELRAGGGLGLRWDL